MSNYHTPDFGATPHGAPTPGAAPYPGAAPMNAGAPFGSAGAFGAAYPADASNSDLDDTKRRRTKAGRGHKTKSAPGSLGLQRKLFALVAVLAALVAVLLLTQTEPVTYVVRTNTEVPALSAIQAAQLSADPIDPASIEPGTLSGDDPAKLLEEAAALVANGRTLVPLSEKQQLRREYLGALPQLAANERLVSLSAQTSRSVGGTLNVGDHIDVYVATTDGRALLLDDDVEIVAITVSQTQLDAASQAQVEDRSKGIGDLLPARPIPGTYIVRVDSAKVAAYVAGDAAGQLALVLRGENAGTTPLGGASIQELLDQTACAGQTEGCQSS